MTQNCASCGLKLKQLDRKHKCGHLLLCVKCYIMEYDQK